MKLCKPDADVAIISAGVIGLSIARELKTRFKNVCIIEKNKYFGLETSSRNSEVIHSGVHYPNNFLKTKLCILGRKLLYEFLEKEKIQYLKKGKLIIAQNEEELIKLKKIQHNSLKSEIKSNIFSRKELKIKEPNLKAKYGLFFPETGVFDSHSFMQKLYHKNLDLGVDIVFNNKVLDLDKIEDRYLFKVQNGEREKYEFTSNIVINCAGLGSFEISEKLGIKSQIYKPSFWKGEYFWLSNESKIKLNSLIYPLPNKDNSGLGIHTTTDIGGRIRLGPNSIKLKNNSQLNYAVDNKNKEIFYKSVKKYLPDIKLSQIMPDQSGIRPKLKSLDNQKRDFIITNESKYGFGNFINLLGIESPGLTSSLAIAKYVSSII